jgi:hypothetical protein
MFKKLYDDAAWHVLRYYATTFLKGPRKTKTFLVNTDDTLADILTGYLTEYEAVHRDVR